MTEMDTACDKRGHVHSQGRGAGTRSLNLAVAAAWRSRVASFVIVPDGAGCSVTKSDGTSLEHVDASFHEMRREVDRRTGFPSHHQRLWSRIKYWINETPVFRGGYWGCRIDAAAEISVYSFVRPDRIECKVFTAMSEHKEPQNPASRVTSEPAPGAASASREG